MRRLWGVNAVPRMCERAGQNFMVAPYSFLTARELVSKSRDGASFKKSTRNIHVYRHRNDPHHRNDPRHRNDTVNKHGVQICVNKFLEQLRESLPVSKHISNEHKTLPLEFQDILPRLTLEKEANTWQIVKKWLSLRWFVAMATVCAILI